MVPRNVANVFQAGSIPVARSSRHVTDVSQVALGPWVATTVDTNLSWTASADGGLQTRSRGRASLLGLWSALARNPCVRPEGFRHELSKLVVSFRVRAGALNLISPFRWHRTAGSDPV